MRHGGIRIARSFQLNLRPTFRCVHLCKPLLGRHVSSDAATTTEQGQTSSASPSRQWSTPLSKTIAQAIEVTGPISIASYMRQCLTNPDGGYYTTRRPSDEPDQFGTTGDFVTSPEISQVFGELVGIWFMTEWMAQGRPREGVQFIEMGPGRGTLMSDILRTVGQFKTFAQAISAVWLVEAGEGLRRKQKDLLCGETTELREINDSTGKNVWWEATSTHGIHVRWVEDVALLPGGDNGGGEEMPFIIAHEFFDALPIHAFESIAPKPEEAALDGENTQVASEAGESISKRSLASKLPQWRELLVAPTTPNLATLLAAEQTALSSKDPDPDFQLVIAKASTPSSLVIPERPRYRALKSQASSRVEISPESFRYVQDFARRIGGGLEASPSKGRSHAGATTDPKRKPAGAALIIDYGPLDTVPVNSLRAIRKHKIVSPFVYAGDADISADVDFEALADAALEVSQGIEVHGPVEQGMWLLQLGIKERADRLLKEIGRKASSNNKEGVETEELDKKIREMEMGWKRLVEGGPKGMGKAYKVMAILPENAGRRRPVGFGGGVVS